MMKLRKQQDGSVPSSREEEEERLLRIRRRRRCTCLTLLNKPVINIVQNVTYRHSGEGKHCSGGKISQKMEEDEKDEMLGFESMNKAVVVQL